MNQTLEAARRYVAAGLSVIPLRAKDKLPLPGFGWKEYATRYATSGELYQWFNNTDYNIALATGELSKVVIIDTDNAEAEMTARRLKITSPLQVLTGKGRHHYFKHPGESVKNAVRKLPGLDIRGDNGYALLPPSIHPSGRTYMWASPFLPAVLNRLPLFPVSTFHVKEENKILGLRQINGWIGQAISGIKEGNRNDTFTRIVGRLHRDNWIESDILALLQPLASHVGLSARELEATVHSVLKYANTPKSLGGDNGGLRLHTFKTSADEYATRRAGRGGGNPDNPTGFPVLDKFIGGLIRREIFTVAARTGTGKTSFLIRLCSNL